MTNISGSLQEKNGTFHMVISYKQDGKNVRKWHSTYLPIKNNRKRAQAMLQDKIQEYKKIAKEENRLINLGLERDADKILLSNYITEWLERKKIEIAMSTYAGYTRITKYLIEYFEKNKIKICDVTPLILEQYYQSLLTKEEPLSANTVIKHSVLLKSVFNELIADGLITYNPVKRAKTPKFTHYNAVTYNAEEQAELIRLLQGNEIEDIVLIAMYYGLRRSEILGLRWDAFDFTDNNFKVQHKIIQANYNGIKRIEKTDNLKTSASRRAFPLVSQVKECLLKRKERRKYYEMLFGSAYDHSNDDYVFLREDGSLLTPDMITDRFRTFISSHNLKKLRFHDLRHSCATMLLSQGYSLRDIQDYLGHAAYQTTVRYAHVETKRKFDAVSSVVNAVENAKDNKDD